MLTRLKYSVTFPSTGRTLEADLDLGPGYWAITGPNESGKSMVFEMARYLLFGTAALRGPGDDYKNLKAEGSFVIRGNVVEITRTAKMASMKRSGVVVATGTTGVNQKVIEELGFGLAVFDVACSINQGEVERLGAMKPAERKAMVDSVLGLAMLDNVSKWAMEEAKLLDRQAEGLRGRLTPAGLAPMEPVAYTPSAGMTEELAQLQADCAELNTLNGWLQVAKGKPTEPKCSIDLPAVNLEQFAIKRRALREAVETTRAKMNALTATTTYTSAQLDTIEQQWAAFHAYDDAQKWLAANPKPRWVSVMQLQVYADDWTALANIEKRNALMERIWQLQAKGSKPCPHCHTDIALEADAIERLQVEHDAIIVPRDGYVPSTPPIPAAAIPAEIHQLRQFKSDLHDSMEAIPRAERPNMDERALPNNRLALVQAAERATLSLLLQAQETEFRGMPDFEAQLAERRGYETALAAYSTVQLDWENWNAERLLKEARRALLLGAPAEHQALSCRFQQAQAYETDLARHTEVVAAYLREMAVIEGLEADAVEHRKVREVMNVLRGLIKQHVLPSLNRVASHLLRQMTGGQRNLIMIDEEFNVLVDGQALETLSGSGKAVANLAIRIGLGQVLTNRVISILLADEIDASMDAFRAEKTSDVLRTLENSVSQVLLVSHKPIDAPHHIRLGELSDDDGKLEDGIAG